MFKVGDRVYAESRSQSGQKIFKGLATVKSVCTGYYKVTFDGRGLDDSIYIDKHVHDYKHDVIRKLTKLEQALQ